MKQGHLDVLRLIRLSRVVRPIVDCTLLAMCLGGYALLQEHTQEKQAGNAAQTRLSKILAQHARQARTNLSVTSTDQQFESEPEMWIGFQNWLAESDRRSGQCSFSTLPTNLPYRMQCTGAHAPGEKPVASQLQVTVPTVLVVTQSPEPVARFRTDTGLPPGKQKDNYRVQGWVDTAQGRRHFEPATGRWTQ